MKPLTAPPLLLKLFSALPTRAVHCAHINSNVPCRQETTPFTVRLCIFKPHLHFFSRHLTLVHNVASHTCPPRFLVLCHFRTPGVFTVQAGFHLPGAGSGSIGPAEVDRSSRDLRQPGELVIITADSLEEARGARMAERTRNSVNLRKSRTLSHHLLGSSDLGETGRANTSLLLVLLVAGAVGGLVIVIGMFFACRGGTKKSFDGVDEGEEGSGRDRERLAPRQRQPKRESRA